MHCNRRILVEKDTISLLYESVLSYDIAYVRTSPYFVI
ncbi:hypothetical protein APHNP_0222 [Anaplasma phagocytophilum str. ApNP]|uniref:Uncharacterized protein n=2 Tax=Anaplasma phagocytophilum TaxID=948 RepID=A0A0F3NHQ0_ANAPH|nr:hypothetical protein APHMUC_0448 [Anaplasma phagocytophilum str. ApMUC09]KJV66434.1 hypothetical protein APHNP_0222 [Anaplasma phagocytophilum str. ApNP]